MKLDNQELIKQGKGLKLEDCISVPEFVDQLRKNGKSQASNSAIHYHLTNTDKLDYIEFGGNKFIVKNEKFHSFELGANYGKKRSIKISL